MKSEFYIRTLTPADLPAIRSVVDDNQMFPSEMLRDMTASFFQGESMEHWFVGVHRQSQAVIAVAFCAPERMTQGTWNLLLIAVLKKHQGSGAGTQLIEHVEQQLADRAARVLLVETSGLPEYAQTRAFYPKCGYRQIAVIPEYYDAKDDKVVFWKSLTQ